MKYINANKSKENQTACATKYPQKVFKEKLCRLCGTFFKPKSPSELYCTDKCKDIVHTNNYLQRNYGITLEDYNTMYEEQGGVCKVCGDVGFTMAKHHKVKLVVDHNHKTGEVRGLLCHNCNRGLGLFQDDLSILQKAIKYLTNTESYHDSKLRRLND